MHRYAILIDGGFARRALRTRVAADAASFQRLVETLAGHVALRDRLLHRVYFYDATPLEGSRTMPLQGGLVEFGRSPVASESKALFDELKRLPFFSLRMGETALNGWQVDPKALEAATTEALTVTAAQIKPRITQKGVDMRIGMDIAALTLKQHVQCIVLVSGDSDFVPAMKFARREGVQVFLCALGRRVRPAMLEHSDLVLEVDRPRSGAEIAAV